MMYFPLLITHIRQETPDCHTIMFKLPFELRHAFHWFAGQYVRVRLDIKGEEQIRCFSITSPPGSDYLYLTVKANGVGGVSDYINQLLTTDQRVDVSMPLGRFCVKPDVESRQTYYFFAAGSGITPLYNMMLTVLTQEPHSVVNLLYGNRNQQQTIFWKQLHELQQRFEERMHLRFCFSETTIFGYSPWAKGRIDQELAQRFVQEFTAQTDDQAFYICGPGDFIDNLKNGLLQLGMPQEQVFYERFIDKGLNNREVMGVAADLLVDLAGHEYRLHVEPHQTLLEVMHRALLPVPSSCEAGVCGTCMCRLQQGRVEMLNNIALDETQLKRKKILACQSIPMSDKIKIHYD